MCRCSHFLPIRSAIHEFRNLSAQAGQITVPLIRGIVWSKSEMVSNHNFLDLPINVPNVWKSVNRQIAFKFFWSVGLAKFTHRCCLSFLTKRALGDRKTEAASPTIVSKRTALPAFKRANIIQWIDACWVCRFNTVRQHRRSNNGQNGF